LIQVLHSLNKRLIILFPDDVIESAIIAKKHTTTFRLPCAFWFNYCLDL